VALAGGRAVEVDAITALGERYELGYELPAEQPGGSAVHDRWLRC
jgi:hypothetical protein